MARHFPVPESSLGGGSVHPITLGLLAFVFLLSSCAPTTTRTTSVKTSSTPLITDEILADFNKRLEAATEEILERHRYFVSGASKYTDQFTGQVVCAQAITDRRHPNNLATRASLNENGVYTFTLYRDNLSNFVYHPLDGNGLLLRFSDGKARGYRVADNDITFDPNHDKQSVGRQKHTLIVDKLFFQHFPRQRWRRKLSTGRQRQCATRQR